LVSGANIIIQIKRNCIEKSFIIMEFIKTGKCKFGAADKLYHQRRYSTLIISNDK